MNYYIKKRFGGSFSSHRQKNTWKTQSRRIAELVIHVLGMGVNEVIALCLILWNHLSKQSLQTFFHYLNELWNSLMKIKMTSLNFLNEINQEPLAEIEDTLYDDENENSFNCNNNCNSSDGERDSGILWTDAEDFDSVDGLNSPPPFSPNSKYCSSSGRSGVGTDYSSDEDKSPEKKENSEPAQLVVQLLAQLELLFSNEHLEKDGFLLKHIRRRTDGFVSLKLLAGLRKVKKICRDFDVIVSTARSSPKLEVNPEGTKIRRVEALTQHLKSLVVPGLKDKEGYQEKRGDNRRGYHSNGASSDSGQEDTFISKTNGHKYQVDGYRHNSRVFKSAKPGSPVDGGSNYFRPVFNFESLSPEGCRMGNPRMHPNTPRPQIIRHRGTALEVPVVMSGHSAHSSPPRSFGIPEAHGHPIPHIYPSPPFPSNHAFVYPPKPCSPTLNHYKEGTDGPIIPISPTGRTSQWLQRRHASTKNLGSNPVLSEVIRQPRGPDGTSGFSVGYLERIREERGTTAVMEG